MSIPTTTDQYMLREAKGFSSLALEKDVPIPSLGSRDVLVQIEAVSLNFRDLIIADGTYPFPTTLPVVPCSDASATVLSTGPASNPVPARRQASARSSTKPTNLATSPNR